MEKLQEILKAKKSAKDKKIEKVMREFKEGKLKSGSGKIVTDRDQALAIAMSEAGVSRKAADIFSDLLKANIKYGQKDGHGKGKGMPDGMRRNKNENECEEDGPGKGKGEGTGKGENRKDTNKAADKLNDLLKSGYTKKYIRRWKGKTGRWEYEYAGTPGGAGAAALSPKDKKKQAIIYFDRRAEASNEAIKDAGYKAETIQRRQAEKLIKDKKAYFDGAGIFRILSMEKGSGKATPAIIKSDILDKMRDLLKAKPTKYSRRWKSKSGKWRYEYKDEKRDTLSRSQKTAQEALGIKESDNPELRQLKLERAKLQNKALRQIPHSPAQKETKRQIEELKEKIKKMESDKKQNNVEKAIEPWQSTLLKADLQTR